MATQGRALAKNRTQVVQQALIDGGGLSLGGDFPGHVIYYAKTTDNTATEAFINGKGGAIAQGGTTYYNRLYIPESTVVMADYNAVIYNATDDTFSFDKGYVVIANINGTTAGLDVLNGDATAGDDIFVRLAIPESAALDDGLTVSEFLGGATLAWTADDTNDFLKLTVTGITAKTMYWKVYLATYTLNETEAISNFFFGDTAAQDDGD